jgi:hypothetical protein
MMASSRSQIGVIKLLLEAGADTETRDDVSRTLYGQKHVHDKAMEGFFFWRLLFIWIYLFKLKLCEFRLISPYFILCLPYQVVDESIVMH